MVKYMDNQTYNAIVSFIWGIADDCLRDVYVRGKYRDVILPMTVIRRLDAVLEDTKDDVLAMKKNLDAAGIINQTEALCQAAKQTFCNASQFRLKDLTSRANQQKLKSDFIEYLDGFSPNVQGILEKFKFRVQIDTMVDADILGAVIEKFVSPTVNLSPFPVLDDVGGIRLPALDNHTMGVIFEELIRRFNEENNEEAGEHFTPRDVVELMADLVFMPVADKIKDSTYSCYDGACGTGGMLTVSQDRLLDLAGQGGKSVSIHLFGQEINPETYAITRADMLLKGEGSSVENIAYGSTLSDDRFPSRQFDFMLSNPPYGKSWKNDADKLGGKKGIIDTRFVTSFAGEGEFSMIPRVSDGQLLFLLNNVAKMKETTELGSRIAEVHNGSSLFTGDAGQGESNARRYMIERDLVEAIIALPNNMFYNTGIGTFIWVLSNRKENRRKGKIQLIDATALKSPLRKNLGQKNCELTPELRNQIIKLYFDFEDNEYSKIFDNSAFGYWKVSVLRPQYENGSPVKDKKGKLIPDKDLTDTEQIPLDYPGGIDAFIKAEVLPYAPDAWVDDSKTQIGYEISFTKHFYKPVQLRERSEIIADIRALEGETEGLLEEILRT
jgi:type I restriction enzyme M protein